MTEAQTKWIAELRSGNHVQGKYYTNKEGKCDPFGVASILFNIKGRELKNGIVLYDNHAHQPSDHILRILRIRRTVNIEHDLVSQIHRLNDEKCLSFTEIADFLVQWFSNKGSRT